MKLSIKTWTLGAALTISLGLAGCNAEEPAPNATPMPDASTPVTPAVSPATTPPPATAPETKPDMDKDAMKPTAEAPKKEEMPKEEPKKEEMPK